MYELFEPTPEHQQLRSMLRDFVEREVDPQALEHDRDEKFNLPLFRKLGELDLLGLTIPPELGGAGLDAVAVAIVHEELSAADPAFTLSYLAHSLLCVNNLYVNGNDEQRERLLPALASGEKIGGMCMSEPGAGTDVMGLRTTARERGDHFILNGSKMWITNGALNETELGDVFLVYARLEGAPRNAITMFIVEKGFEGFKLGQKIQDKMGMRASMTAELVFEDCVVPRDNIVGEIGSATLCMMRNLEIERLGLAAMSLGIARRSIEIMNRYASERESFGRPLREYGQIQKYIADSYAEYMAGRAYTYLTAGAMKLDQAGHRLDSDGVKLFCSAMGKNVADRAIQVLGGYGYTGEYNVERLYRDAKLLEIGGGTLEAHHKNMTRDLSRVDKIR